jgi:hypothetical protein
MATTSAGDAAGPDPCWCTRVAVPAGLVDALPEDAKGIACLCASCIAEFGQGSG